MEFGVIWTSFSYTTLRDKSCCHQTSATIAYTLLWIRSWISFDHGAAFYLNFDHLNIGRLAFVRAWWVVEAIPNVLEEAFLSTFREVMLLSLMQLLQFSKSCLHQFCSSGTSHQVVWNVGVITSKDICRPVETVMRRTTEIGLSALL